MPAPVPPLTCFSLFGSLGFKEEIDSVPTVSSTTLMSHNFLPVLISKDISLASTVPINSCSP